MTDIAAVQIAWLYTYSLDITYIIITHLVHITHKLINVTFDIDITFTFILGGIHAVKHNLNPCQPPYPIIYQSFAMEAQADATRCCIIVILLVQSSLEEWGCNEGKHRGITPPNISTALYFLKMCAEIIPDQVCPFYWMTAPLNSLKLLNSAYFQYFLRV